MPVEGPRVLVSGASVAGPVLAYWLQRFGFSPTVIERTPEVRMGGGGHAVDLFGPALDVMGWMGTLRDVQHACTRNEVISLIRPGKRPIEVIAEAVSEGVSERHVEIMRGDLAGILHEAVHDQVEYVFDDSVATLNDTGSAVEVTFERGAAKTYDFVVGADGLHSTTRRLVFGPESTFGHFLGGYLAAFTVPNYLPVENKMLTFSVPRRTVGMYPVRESDQARVIFLWRAPTLLDYDRHDLGSQRALLRAVYGDLGCASAARRAGGLR